MSEHQDSLADISAEKNEKDVDNEDESPYGSVVADSVTSD